MKHDRGLSLFAFRIFVFLLRPLRYCLSLSKLQTSIPRRNRHPVKFDNPRLAHTPLNPHTSTLFPHSYETPKLPPVWGIFLAFSDQITKFLKFSTHI